MSITLMMCAAALLSVAKPDAPVFSPDRFTVLNIVPCRPGQEQQTAADAVAFARETGNSVALYSLTLHPEGRPATVKLEKLLASYRAFATALAGTEVRPGILIQAVIGHWPRTDKDIEPWTRTVNIRGEKVRFCPLDPDFRAYIRAVAEGVAREKPCFILSDDDVRAYSHEAECFCPLHAAEFSKRMGRAYTPEEYRAAVRDAKAGDKALEVFRALQEEMVFDVAAQLRAGIDAVDPAIPSGVCSATTAIRYVDQEAKAMAGPRHEPIFRVNNALYMENSPKALTSTLKHTMAAVVMNPDIPYILDESDTFPHNLWSKASVGVHAKLVAGIVAGLRGSKLWYCGMHKHGWPVHANFTRVFARHRGFYDALVREVAGSRPYGLLESVVKDSSDWHPRSRSTSWSRPYEINTWTDGYAGVMGVPFAMQDDLSVPGVWSLSGSREVARLSDAELRAILAHPVLVDADAASALARRGFADLIGVKVDDKTPLFNGEVSADGRQVYPYSYAKVPHLVPQAGAKVLSYLTYSPYSGAKGERVAPASTIFENSLGGRVLVSTFNPRIDVFSRFNEPRKVQFEKFLAELNGAPLKAVVANEQDVLAVAREKADGSLLFAAVNLNFDALDTLDLRVAKRPTKVELMADDGTWKPLAYTVEGNVLHLQTSLPCYDAAVVRLGFAVEKNAAKYPITESARRNARAFIDNEKQFQLGFLPTEQSNPITATLEADFRRVTRAGVECLQRGDRQISITMRHVFDSEQFTQLVDAMVASVTGKKGRIIFSGCGATGRLSILLESVWRDFFHRRAAELSPEELKLANRSASIMTGGDFALIKSVEFFEDYAEGGRRQAAALDVGEGDTFVAITEGGETSSVLGTLAYAAEHGARCFLVYNNPTRLLRERLDRCRRAIDDPRVTVIDLYCGSMSVAGSTRMQATTSEQLLGSAALEAALCRVLPRFAPRVAPDYTLGFEQLLAALESDAGRRLIADQIEFEKGVYEAGGRITYLADKCMLDLFTDNTERGPTFMIPPLRSSRELNLPQSWAFVKNPHFATERCWTEMMRRTPRCLEFTADDARSLGMPQTFIDHPPLIKYSDLITYRIGNEAAPERIAGYPRAAAVVLKVDANDDLDAAEKLAAAWPETRQFNLSSILDSQPSTLTSSPLEIWKHLAVKLAFNCLSTGTMAKMGRIAGNWMSWVSMSNKKLIDRSIRLVSELGGIGYEEAAVQVFAAQEWVKAQDWTAREEPSPVQVVLESIRKNTEK